MNPATIYHRPLSEFAFATDGTHYVFRLRTGKGETRSCRFFYADRAAMTPELDFASLPMKKIREDRYFDWYEVRLETKLERIAYYFELSDGAETLCYFGDCYEMAGTPTRADYFQLPFNHRADRLSVPEWTKDAVVYNIFPDSFADGFRTLSGGSDGKTGLGGTIRGVTENLDYIASMGFNCIYLNPIFEAASYHKYDTIDYFEIDPCLGNKADLKELVQQCHKRGIRVILDGVFNHCGADFFAFRDVRQKGKASRYYNWFYYLPETIQYADPPDYEAFAYVKEMPKLNTGNPEVVEYLCNVGTYWIREADIDGWRLDVANEINHEFWRVFRHAVRAVKEDIFLIGEIWEEAGIWLQGDQFDSTMNYTFSYLCRDFFGKGELSVSEFDAQMQRMIYRYPWQVSLAQMNFLDSHDIPRFLSYCNGNRKRMELAFFYLFMGVGVPSVFYGDEVYIEGMKELEYRAAMDWQAVMEQQAENNRLQGNLAEKFSCWIALRKEHVALRKGNYRTIYCNDMMGVYVFLRSFGDDKVLVFLNTGTGSVTLTSVEVPQLQEKKIILSSCEGKLLVVL